MVELLERREVALGTDSQSFSDEELVQPPPPRREEQPKLPLAQILRSAGIKPFTPETVIAYKKAMLRGRFQIFNKKINEDSWIAVVLLAGFLINSLVAYGIGILLGGHDFLWLAAIPIASCALGTISAIIGVSLEELVGRTSKTGWFITCFFLVIGLGSFLCIAALFAPDREWRIVPLSQYTKKIPQSVLETIDNLRMRCPTIYFDVEELTQRPDPFLVVILGKERYHIEVWGEPNWRA